MAEVFNFYVQDNRSIIFPKNNLLEPIMQEDKDVATWRFRIPKVLNEIDMSQWAWWFVYVNANGQEFSELLTLTDDIDEPDSYNTADYDIDYGISKFPGSFSFALEAISTEQGGEISGEWHTKTYKHKVDGTLQGNQAEYAETEHDIISALITEYQNLHVGTNQITDGAVTFAKLANDAVTSVKIADGAVTNGKLASNSVSTANVQDGAITEAKVANSAVTMAKLAGGSVTETKLASDSVSSDKVQDGAITEPKLATALKLKTIKDYVTPEMYGAAGDGETDDTEALQAAFANQNHLPVFMGGNYKTTEELIIGYWNNYVLHAEGSSIDYGGTGSAVVIQKCMHGAFYFGNITAPNGTCIEIRAIDWQTPVGYSKISFEKLSAYKYCMYGNIATNGYCNQMQIYGGRFAEGEYGVYIKNNTQDAKYNVNEWTFNYCGIEGVSTGFKFESLTNYISDMVINYPRFKEDTLTTIFLETSGTINYCTVYCVPPVRESNFIVPTTDDNQVFVNAPIYSVSEGKVVSRRAQIRRGEWTFYREINKYYYDRYLSNIFEPVEFYSPSSTSDKKISEINNPLTYAESLIAEDPTANRFAMCVTNNTTGFETYAPAAYQTYFIMQRQNRATIYTQISVKFYVNIYSGGSWSGWRGVALS